MNRLEGRNVAVLVADGFEESELTSPVDRLKSEGATVSIVSPNRETVRSWSGKDWSRDFDVDKHIGDVNAGEFDALLLPGGVINPDILRTNKDSVMFVRSFFESKKPIGAICHGPWMLVEADVLKGRKATSFKSIRTDLENAGASWEDSEVVVDQGLVTSRSPSDLPAFNDKLVEEIAEGKHTDRVAAENAEAANA